MTNERSLKQLAGVAKADTETKFPYFEALLKSSRVGGATPGFSIVAVRLLNTQ